jgi:two-component sensor histidine kinase
MKNVMGKMRIKSENRRVLHRFTILALLSGLLLIVLFYLVEMNHIQSSAVRAIESAKLDGTSEAGKLPEAYTLYADDLYKGILTETENRLVFYYLENENVIPDREISQFEKDDVKVFFMSTGIQKIGNDFFPKDGAILVYADVSFAVDLVNNTVWILLGVLVCIAILLFLAGRYFGRMLDAKDEGLKQFFANASHELKTPLMAIQGNVDGIRSGYVNTENACQVIDKATDRMIRLIGDILELSKLDSGMMTPHMEDADIREILYDAMNIIEPVAVQKNIQIEENMPRPIFRPCDEEMLFSAFSNILTNSVRYAASRIEIALSEDEHCRAKISICNDGDVLGEEEKKHIFDRFYKGKKGQSGIGLSLSLGYIKLQQGDIRVLAKENRTIFEITI